VRAFLINEMPTITGIAQRENEKKREKKREREMVYLFNIFGFLVGVKIVVEFCHV